MARGHVSDTWHKTVAGTKVRTERYGRGLRWQAVWDDPATGRERTKAFKLKPDAETHVVAMQASQLRGEYIDPNAGRVTLTAYARQWQASRPYGPSAAVQRDVHLRVHILPKLGAVPLAAILPSTVQAWLVDLPGAESTKRAILKTLGALLGAAVEDGLIRSNPVRARSVTKPKVATKTIVPWSVEQVRTVADGLPERYRILAMLGAGLGLRSGEVYGLAVSDVDFLRRVVTVRRQVRLDASRQRFALPKFEHVREIPLPDIVAHALAAHLAEFPPVEVTLPWASRERAEDGVPTTVALVVASREGRALNKNYVSANLWRPALRAAGMPDQRDHGFHALRHTFASTLLDGGVSIRALADYLGHADPSFTLRVYAHLMPQSEVRARSVVDTAWSSRGAVAEREEFRRVSPQVKAMP